MRFLHQVRMSVTFWIVTDNHQIRGYTFLKSERITVQCNKIILTSLTHIANIWRKPSVNPVLSA